MSVSGNMDYTEGVCMCDVHTLMHVYECVCLYLSVCVCVCVCALYLC